MQPVLDTLIAVTLLLLAIGVVFTDVIRLAAVNLPSSLERNVASAYYAQGALLDWLNGGGSGTMSLSPDRLLLLSNVPGGPRPASPSVNYTTLRGNIHLSGEVNFNLDMRAPLVVDVNATSNGFAVGVLKAYGGTTVSALLRMYVFNGTAVTETLSGQAGISGSVLFQATLPPRSVAVFIAHAGSASGFNVTGGSGPVPDGPLYVDGGVLGGAVGVEAYAFAYEGYSGPFSFGGTVNLSGFSLPAVFVYQWNGAYAASMYPRLPVNYGIQPVAGSSSVVTLMAVEVVSGSLVTMKLQAWPVGGS